MNPKEKALELMKRLDETPYLESVVDYIYCTGKEIQTLERLLFFVEESYTSFLMTRDAMNRKCYKVEISHDLIGIQTREDYDATPNDEKWLPGELPGGVNIYDFLREDEETK